MLKYRLKVILADREITQKELAEITGIRPPTISAFATGKIKQIPVNVLNEICKTLNCQPGDLIEYMPD